MRKLCHKKTLFVCLSFLFCSLFCLLSFSPVSALNFGSGGSRNFSEGYVRYLNSSSSIYGSVNGSDFIFGGTSGSDFIGNIFIRFDEPMPAQSLYTFTVEYRANVTSITGTDGSAHMEYAGLNLNFGGTVLADSCITSGSTGLNIFNNAITCRYLVYTNAGSEYIASDTNSRLVKFYPASSSTFTIIVSDANYISVSNNGLSADDRDWLESVIPVGSSTSDIESAIESAREDEQQQIQDAVDESQDDIESDMTQAESTSQNLLSAFSQFVTVVSAVQPTNCIIDFDVGYFRVSNVNLCSLNTPPLWTSVISTVVVIGFIVPLSISAFNKFIGFIKEIQS